MFLDGNKLTSFCSVFWFPWCLSACRKTKRFTKAFRFGLKFSVVDMSAAVFFLTAARREENFPLT